MTGQQISHYRIISPLGSGGMGEVYLAHDSKLNRKVAIKLLPVNSMTDATAKRRLLREARAAASLDHPNICTIHEVGEHDGCAFIVMQFVEGETLAERLTGSSLGPSECIETAIQIADALAAAHSVGIIHRDIKPQNIMLTRKGQIKMLDFGLAKISLADGFLDSEAETQSMLTESGVIMGTVPYMSPEQVKGEALDARSDVFSFGAVLYEMISGRSPFAAKTAAETISAILVSDPPSLSGSFPTLPPSLIRVVNKCLEKNREDRYPGAAEVKDALEIVRRQYQSGEAVQASEDSTAILQAPQTKGIESRGRVGLVRRTALIAIVVLLAAFASVYALFLRAPRKPNVEGKYINSPAYEPYMQGHVIVNNENPDDNEAAIRLLQQAVKADPEFAPGWSDLSRAYNIKAFFYAPTESEKKQLMIQAEVAVEKALSLNPELADAHAAKGLLLWTHAKRFPHEQAIQSYKRAIELNPNFADAHHRLAVVYFHVGLLDKAWSETEEAVKIDPANTLARFRFGVINMYRTNYEQALDIFKSTPREMNPALVDRNMADVLFHLGRIEEASGVVEDYLKTHSSDEGGAVTSAKAMLLARAGKRAEAEDTIQQAITIGRGYGHFHHTAYNIASAYALMNQPAKAVEWLEVAADDGFPCYPFFDKDENLDNIRKDQQFIAFMARLRSQWEHYQQIL